MKIAHLLTTNSPVTTSYGGAVERIVLSLSYEQAKKGHSVHIFSANDQVNGLFRPNLWIHNIPIYLPRPFSDIEYLFKVRQKMHDLQPSVIHSHSSPFAALLLGDGAAPHVGSFNFFRFKGSKRNFGRRIYKYLLSKFDLLTSITQFAATGIYEYFSLEEIPRILHCGVDLSFFNPDAKQIEFSNIQSFESSITFILFVGRVNHQKGAHLLPIIAKELKQFKINTVAVGPINQFHKVSELNLDKFNLGEDVIYLGNVEQSQLATLMARASVLIVPTLRDEMFGMVIPEAGACGTPAVASDIDGIPEVIGTGGCLVPVGDTQAFLDVILDLVTNPLKLEIMSKNALKNAERFSWSNICAKSLVYYQTANKKNI